jgi:hypothetical protein
MKRMKCCEYEYSCQLVYGPELGNISRVEESSVKNLIARFGLVYFSPSLIFLELYFQVFKLGWI